MNSGNADSRGANPVIGVVLMVAVVVVLAAGIGSFLLDIGQQQPRDSPRVAVVADYDERTTANGEYLNLSFESGDTVPREELSLAIDGARDSSGNSVSLSGTPIQAQAPTEIKSGTEITINAEQFSGVGSGEHLDLGEATLRMVWDPVDADESKTYVIYRWPDPSQR